MMYRYLIIAGGLVIVAAFLAMTERSPSVVVWEVSECVEEKGSKHDILLACEEEWTYLNEALSGSVLNQPIEVLHRVEGVATLLYHLNYGLGRIEEGLKKLRLLRGQERWDPTLYEYYTTILLMEAGEPQKAVDVAASRSAITSDMYFYMRYVLFRAWLQNGYFSGARRITGEVTQDAAKEENLAEPLRLAIDRMNGTVAYLDGDYENALEWFRRGQDSDAILFENYRLEAATLMKAGQKLAALEQAEKALNIIDDPEFSKPDLSRVLLLQGEIYLSANPSVRDFEAAAVALGKADGMLEGTSIDPYYRARISHRLAEAYLGLGQYREAGDAFQRALELDQRIRVAFSEQFGVPLAEEGALPEGLISTVRACLPNGCRPILPKRCNLINRRICAPDYF